MPSSKPMASGNADRLRRSSASPSPSKLSCSPSLSHYPNRYREQRSAPAVADDPIDDQNFTAMTVDEHRDNNGAPGCTLLNAEITLMDSVGSIAAVDATMAIEAPVESLITSRKTVDDVWREIVSGKRECKVEMDVKDEKMITLEDFLAKAGAGEQVEVKASLSPPLHAPETQRSSGGVFAMDIPTTGSYVGPQQGAAEGGVLGFSNEVDVMGGRGNRIPVFEHLDKAAAQRQRRMIKNRESAARSRERKQAYQTELESLALKLDEENLQLLKDKELLSKERYKRLMEKVVPITEKRKPTRVLRRVCSVRW